MTSNSSGLDALAQRKVKDLIVRLFNGMRDEDTRTVKCLDATIVEQCE